MPAEVARSYRVPASDAAKVRLSEQQPFRLEVQQEWSSRLCARYRALKRKLRESGEHYIQVGESLRGLHDMTASVIETAGAAGRAVDDGVRVITLARDYRQAHGRWPESMDALQTFAVQRGAMTGQIDWNRYGQATFAILDDEYLSIVYPHDRQRVELGISPKE